MDQMTAACGRRGHLLELLCQPAEVVGHVALPPALELFGIDSGIRHAVSGADYGSVRAAAFMGYRIVADAAGLAARGRRARGAWRSTTRSSAATSPTSRRPNGARAIATRSRNDCRGAISWRASADRPTPRPRSMPTRATRCGPRPSTRSLEHDRVRRFRALLADGAATTRTRACSSASSCTNRTRATRRAASAPTGPTASSSWCARPARPRASTARRSPAAAAAAPSPCSPAAGSRAAVDEIARRYQQETGRDADDLRRLVVGRAPVRRPQLQRLTLGAGYARRSLLAARATSRRSGAIPSSIVTFGRVAQLLRRTASTSASVRFMSPGCSGSASIVGFIAERLRRPDRPAASAWSCASRPGCRRGSRAPRRAADRSPPRRRR